MQRKKHTHGVHCVACAARGVDLTKDWAARRVFLLQEGGGHNSLDRAGSCMQEHTATCTTQLQLTGGMMRHAAMAGKRRRRSPSLVSVDAPSGTRQWMVPTAQPALACHKHKMAPCWSAVGCCGDWMASTAVLLSLLLFTVGCWAGLPEPRPPWSCQSQGPAASGNSDNSNSGVVASGNSTCCARQCVLC